MEWYRDAKDPGDSGSPGDGNAGRARDRTARPACVDLPAVPRPGAGREHATGQRPRPEAAVLPAHGGVPRPGWLGVHRVRPRGVAGTHYEADPLIAGPRAATPAAARGFPPTILSPTPSGTPREPSRGVFLGNTRTRRGAADPRRLVIELTRRGLSRGRCAARREGVVQGGGRKGGDGPVG